MYKVNKNLSHDRVDYVNGEVLDADAGEVLHKMGHADKVEAEVAAPKAKKPAVKVDEVPAEVPPVAEESFDDVEDDAPPVAKKAPAKKAKK